MHAKRLEGFTHGKHPVDVCFNYVSKQPQKVLLCDCQTRSPDIIKSLVMSGKKG